MNPYDRMNRPPQIIKLEAELDTTKQPCECRIKAIENPWMDFGYFLEATAFLAVLAMKQKARSKKEILQYIRDYCERAMSDYDKQRN